MLWPLQTGVAAPGGAGAAIRAVRQWAERNAGDPGKVLVKVDVENVFSTVDREAVLRKVRLRAPALGCWADWCYGAPRSCYVFSTGG